MSLNIIARILSGVTDAPTLAERVDQLIGNQADAALNDPDASVAEALFALAVETVLTVEHIAELFIVRPAIALVTR